MKNRKGFLLAEETLKIVIAIICLIFLVGFLGKLYYSHKGDKDLELAKASLEHLVSGINSEATEIEIYNPEGWLIIPWPASGENPPLCKSSGWENCICICPKKWYQKIYDVSTFEGRAKQCSDNGVCLESNKKIRWMNYQGQVYEEISPPMLLEINYGNEISLKSK